MNKQVVGVVGFVVVVAAAIGTMKYLHGRDAGNLAEEHAKDLILSSRGQKPEAALASFDKLISSEDWANLPAATRENVAIEVVRRATQLVPDPFTPRGLDDANRAVARYRGLPEAVRRGAVRDEMLSALERWVKAVPEAPKREARISLLRLELEVAGADDTLSIGSRLANERLEMARSIAENWPVDALGFLAEEPRAPAGVGEASKIVARLVEQPALLVDAGRDLDAWLASVPAADPLREAALSKREIARAAKVEDDVETDPTKLAALLAKRPWDQWLVVKLASAELGAGDTAAAEKRLQTLGAPGFMIREATLLYSRLAFVQNQLEAADNVLSGLLGSRLQRFLAVNARLEATAKFVEDRVIQQLRSGNVPPAIRPKLEAATEADQRPILEAYFRDTLEAEPGIVSGRAALLELADVVPAAMMLGMVKLRRAHGMAGADRDAMLGEAERAFLTVRTAAVGQPEYHLGLGEIYARLGKTKESEAELQELLGRKDAQLSLRVAAVYRGIGNDARATALATNVFETASERLTKDSAAMMLAAMGRDDEERERWYRKVDASRPEVRTALLEIEAHKLLREGKRAECDKKLAEAARLTLERAAPGDIVTANNAALATQQRFQCTGDVARLREAEAALEAAYRRGSDQPILILNLAQLLRVNADLRLLAKRIDVTALRLDHVEADELVRALLDGPERAAVVSDLAKDPGWRRSAELFAQLEMLMPAGIAPYIDAIDRASRLLDREAAAAALERIRRAKNLDTSVANEAVQRRLDATDAKRDEAKALSEIARDKEILSHPLDVRTRAAALLRSTGPLMTYGVNSNHPEHVTAARAALEEVTKLWPSLTVRSARMAARVDEAGLAADGVRWSKLRRLRGSVLALDQLVRDKDPLAAKIRASSAWSELTTELRAATGSPTPDDLILARLVNDPAGLTWARGALDDVVARHGLEARRLLAPKDVRVAEYLAALSASAAAP